MCVFSKPAAPAAVAAPSPPPQEPKRTPMRDIEQESSQAQMDEARRLKSSRNASTNVFTSGMGLTATPETLKKPTVLGQ